MANGKEIIRICVANDYEVTANLIQGILSCDFCNNLRFVDTGQPMSEKDARDYAVSHGYSHPIYARGKRRSLR